VSAKIISFERQRWSHTKQFSSLKHFVPRLLSGGMKKEFMISETVHCLSRFELHTRTTHSTDLATLVEFARLADPGGYFDLRITLSEQLLSLLSAGTQTQIKPAAEIGVS
jgi:hypothetical protein